MAFFPGSNSVHIRSDSLTTGTESASFLLRPIIKVENLTDQGFPPVARMVGLRLSSA